MMLEIGLIQKQTTKLVMTTELRQAISILQYSNVELIDFIKEEALENPLIELKEEKLVEDIPMFSQTFMRSPSLTDSDDEKDSPVDYFHSKEENLRAFLLKQLQELSFYEYERGIAKFLIENINDAGYLTISLEEAATLLNQSEDDVSQAFEMFREFEPTGIGARTLQECLLWQLEGLEERSPLTEKIVANDLERFAEKKWPDLAKKYDVSLADIQASADLIRLLNPKPGSSFSDETTKYLHPDVTVEKRDGDYVVTVNDYMLPSIQLNRQYHYLLSQVGQDEAQKYMNEKYNKMLWLIRSIEQRRLTLQKLTEAIVKRQTEFLEKGLSYLKPLTLKEIADEIEVHESTVSRAVRQKIIQTPKGIFEMKDLFTSKVQSADGDGASSTAVKQAIVQLVEEENKQKPLSDQKISELLKEREGITISRRTVAKYREELNILSSAKRKRFQ